MACNPTLIHMLASNRWGGIERYALDICRHFKDAGWDVTAVTRDAVAIDSLFKKEGISLIPAPLRGFSDLVSIKTLATKLRGTPENVIIHVHGCQNAFTAIMARKWSGKKDVRIIMTRHKVKAASDTILHRFVYRNIDAIVFVSQMVREKFLSTWEGRHHPFTDTEMHVLHNSLNIPHPEYHQPSYPRPLTAMFHGPLQDGKGIETIIDALSLLRGKRIRMKIVGSGRPDYVDRLRQRAIAGGVMEMIDWHKHTDDPSVLISMSDFGVLPSVEEEAFGLSNLEYMAGGRPQICSSNGAQSEYITDGCEGFLIPPENPEILAESITRLALDPNLRSEMGKNAFNTFTGRLSWGSFISRVEDIYTPSF